MTPEQLHEVWAMLDKGHLAEVARKGPEPIFATISGAHLYGFASPDSDVDLRGAFMLPASDMLGLRPSVETITIEDKTTIDLDWVAHDIRKFTGIHLMEAGEVIANIQVLNERFRFREIDELVARERTGAEKMALDERDMEEHGALLDRLETELQEAHDASQLPDEPTSVAALQDFVVRLRLRSARSEGA